MRKNILLSCKAISIFLIVLALLTFLTACGTTSADATATPTAQAAPTDTPTAQAAPTDTPTTGTTGGNQVTISNFSFQSATLNVSVGTTVTWTNKDSAAHTVTADQGGFDSGSLSPGATFSFTFTTAGTYAYHCKFHPSMKAKIVVV